MKRKKLDKNYLQMMLDEHKSVGKVSAELSIPYSTVYAWYKNYGIKLMPSNMTIYEELRKTRITKTHRSVIIGSILGDGSLIKNRKSKNARLQIGHCTKQLPYLKWKKDLLNPFVKQLTLAEKEGKKTICGKESYSTGYYIINTIAHPDITDYYYRYYKKGKKRVIPDIIDEMDWLALSIWLADDGSFSFHGSKTALRGSIATCSFTTKELEILVEALKKFFKGSVGISSNNTLILGKTSCINDLLNKISSILPKEIHYKLVPQRLMRETPTM